MPAAYQTGISSSPTNLLQTLVTWLVAQGWTSDSSVADGAGWRAHLHKGGLYVNFRATGNETIWPAVPSGTYDASAGWGIGFYLGDGYSGAAAWHAQSGRPLRSNGAVGGCGINLPQGSVAAYHFFDDGSDHVTVVVERSPGIFAHLGWGPKLTATGNPEDFWYFFGSSSAYRTTFSGVLSRDLGGYNVTAFCPMSHANPETADNGDVHAQAYVRVDAATYASRWVGDAEDTDPVDGYTGRRLRSVLTHDSRKVGGLEEGQYPNYRYLIGRIHQAGFPGAVLLPLHYFVETATARWARVGHPPTVFWCDGVGHGYSAGQVVPVGGLDYMLFPNFAVRKGA